MSTNTAQMTGYISSPIDSPRDYSDIIHLSRPVITNHPPMPRAARAAQFAPFAALATYNEVVAEVEENNIYTGSEIIADEDYYDEA